MRRLGNWAAIAAIVAAALTLGVQPADGPASPRAKVDRIARGMRCPVCQGLSVRDSDSSTARSIRDDIARRVDEGQTAADIRQAYVDRYGEWILLRPRTSGFGSLLWAVPAAAAAGGGVMLGWVFWRWRRQRPGRAPTGDERTLVGLALHDHMRNGEAAR